MVRYSFFTNDKELLKNFGKYSNIIGIFMLILGVLGILFPVFASIASAFYLGWILLFSGFFIAIHTYKTNKKDWLGWLKSVILLITGAFTVVNPLPGVAALGIIFTIYFLMDAFSSMALAFELKPQKGWWWSLINSFLSIIIAAYIIAGWPVSSIWIVGLLVGISLFFDGVVLITLGSAANKISKE